MGSRLTALLCVAALGCGKEPPPQTLPAPAGTVVETHAVEAQPWPRLKTIIVADMTPPETRPVDLEIASDKALRSAMVRDGRFHSALSDDTGACAVEVKLFYGLMVNGELRAEGDQGEAKLVMEAEAHCPTQGRSAGEIETYRATVGDEKDFSRLEDDEKPDGITAIRAMLGPMSEQVAITLHGQVTVRHASDAEVIEALVKTRPEGVLMEAASEAGERKLVDALPGLVGLTEHKDEVVGLRAGAALGLIGVDGDGVISALARMTEGPNQERHLIAVHAMGDIGGDRAARYLDALAVGHPHAVLREAAREAAKRARGSKTKADMGIPPGHDAPPDTGAKRP